MQKRIEGKLREHVYPILRKNPYFGPNINRLKNWDPSTWRNRVGEWRFFYEVDDRDTDFPNESNNMRDLFNCARSIGLGLDRALDSILAALGPDEPAPAEPSEPPEITDGDVPF